uniref:Uncharacterized protein n=1 Tax=Oryza sativa subsp. japonica TaxID=39947 RepID=Q109A5_ORYSJ|nr:hypothetical protein LOC_Os10g39934 [Oryza sativa Japonica Group]
MEGTRRHLEEDLEPWKIIEDVQVKVEAQTKSTSGAIRSPGPVCTKTGAQVAYMLGLGRSLYGWKAKKIPFQWFWSHVQILSESMGIDRTSWRPESVPVLRHRIWAFGPCIVLEPIRVASRGNLDHNSRRATYNLGGDTQKKRYYITKY